MSVDVTVAPATLLAGEVNVPGDKSITQRALLMGLISSRPMTIANRAPGEDPASAIAAVEALGGDVQVHPNDPATITVSPAPDGRPVAPDDPIDAGNSGTLARLLMGIAAHATGPITITGDDSLRARPMARVAAALGMLGLDVALTDGCLPATVSAPDGVNGAMVLPSRASAQVQSAVLLAGLNADGPVRVDLPVPVRSHTELLLQAAGLDVTVSGTSVTLEPGRPRLERLTVPGDMSAAAPLIVGATLLQGSLLRLPALGMNPGRIGLIDLLDHMTAGPIISDRTMYANEPVADLEVVHAQVQRAPIQQRLIPSFIDELPLVGLLAQFCKGETEVKGAGELRHKESDRIVTTVRALRNIGINAEETEDGFVVRGSGMRPTGGTVYAAGDHRIAMLGGIAGLVSRSGVTIEGADAVDVSYPGFFEVLDAIAQR